MTPCPTCGEDVCSREAIACRRLDAVRAEPCPACGEETCAVEAIACRRLDAIKKSRKAPPEKPKKAKASKRKVTGKKVIAVNPEKTALAKQRTRDIVVAKARKPKSTSRFQIQAYDLDRYRWMTQNDGSVRPAHAVRHGRIFDWSNPPEGGHPGEDYNCRCYAELVSIKARPEPLGPYRLKQIEKAAKELAQARSRAAYSKKKKQQKRQR